MNLSFGPRPATAGRASTPSTAKAVNPVLATNTTDSRPRHWPEVSDCPRRHGSTRGWLRDRHEAGHRFRPAHGRGREHDAIDKRAQNLAGLGLDAVVVEGNFELGHLQAVDRYPAWKSRKIVIRSGLGLFASNIVKECQQAPENLLWSRWATWNVKIDGDHQANSTHAGITASKHPSSRGTIAESDDPLWLRGRVVGPLQRFLHVLGHRTCNQKNVSMPWRSHETQAKPLRSEE